MNDALFILDHPEAQETYPYTFRATGGTAARLNLMPALDIALYYTSKILQEAANLSISRRYKASELSEEGVSAPLHFVPVIILGGPLTEPKKQRRLWLIIGGKGHRITALPLYPGPACPPDLGMMRLYAKAELDNPRRIALMRRFQSELATLKEPVPHQASLGELLHLYRHAIWAKTYRNGHNCALAADAVITTLDQKLTRLCSNPQGAL